MSKAITFVAGVGETVKGFAGKVAARKWALAEALRKDVPSFRLRDMRHPEWMVFFVPAVAERHGWNADDALKRARQIAKEVRTRQAKRHRTS